MEYKHMKEVTMEDWNEQRQSLCWKIDNQVKLFYSYIRANCDKLNKNKEIQYIMVYSMQLFNAADEVSCLIQMNKFATVLSITRDILECYSIICNMFNTYNDINKFHNFIKSLFLVSLDQEIKTTKELKEFSEVSYKNNFEYIKAKFSTVFKDDIVENKASFDTLKELENVTKLLNKKYKKESTSNIINATLKENEFLKEFNGREGIYRDLCNYTHSNILTLLNNYTIETYEGKTFTSYPINKNINSAVYLILHCIRYVYKEILNILDKKE